MLKAAFTQEPTPRIFDPKQLIVIETNASNKAVRAVISQKGKDRKLYLIAYHSYKLLLAKLNYKIYNKELLAIIDAIYK